MDTKIYKRGARKEYKIIQDLKKAGWDIAQRSAGSHSPIDIFAINRKTNEIKFIQSKRILSKKMKDFNLDLKLKTENEFSWLNGIWLVSFELR